MTHYIQFIHPGVFEAREYDDDQRVRVSIPAGTVIEGTAKCYVKYFVEFGDIFLPEGVLLQVPCSFWQFLSASPPDEN